MEQATELPEESLANRRVFITGGAGFIGSYLAERLHSLGAVVTVLYRSPRRTHLLAEQGIRAIQGSITDAAQMEGILSQRFDLVYHLAAWLRGGPGHQARFVNVEATRQLAQLSAAHGVRRFVFTSSIMVYGPHGDRNVDEATPLQPYGDPYGDSKIEAEQALYKVGAETGLPYVIVRPGMVYGPRSRGWTGRLARWAKSGRTLMIDGGRGTAYPIYIDNLIDLLILCAVRPEAAGEVFNGVDDGPITLETFFKGHMSMVPTHHAIRLPGWLLGLAAAVIDPFTPGLSYRYVVNQVRGRGQVSNEKAKRLLNWQPHVSMEEGLRRSEVWLREEGLL